MARGTRLEEGRARVVIEGVAPEIDGGRFPIKRVPGEQVQVQAAVFADGHDVIKAVVKHRHRGEKDWTETPMEPLVEDRWRVSFEILELGEYLYTIEGWVDAFSTWRRDLEKKFKAGLDIDVELMAGAELMESAAANAKSEEAEELKVAAGRVRGGEGIPVAGRVAIAISTRVQELMERHGGRPFLSRYPKELRVMAEPVLARFSAWYEMFPRSASPISGQHGTFKDCEALLPKIAEMGFDILYLPPIHPIGRAYRKGKNNSLTPTEDDPGSPWAIGGEEGGHKSIHAELGTLEDFRRLVERARELQTRGGTGHRSPVFAGPSLCARASGVVSQAAGRHDPICGEPAQEVPGHLPAGFRMRRLEGAVGGAKEHL